MNHYTFLEDSQIEWIGEIPNHWDLTRIKPLIKSFGNGVWGNEPQGDVNDLICIRVADFDMQKLGVRKDDLTTRNIPISQQNNRLLDKNDLLIEKSGGGDNQPVGRVVQFDREEKAVCSNFIGKISVNTSKILPNYLLYYFYNLYSKEVNTRSIKQTTGIQNLDTNSYFSAQIPIPTLAEQQTIAGFLDRKTSQIDTLIFKKQRLIELLQEYRTALINQVVTKGLDPDVPMKDSGYEWLGKIPDHWELIKLKFVSNVNFSNVDKHTFEEEIPIKLCNYVDVYNNDFIYPNMDFMNATATEKETSKFRLFKDDVLITKDSETWDDIAVPAYVTEDMEDVVCGYHLAHIKPLSINGNFLFWVLNSLSINDQYKVETHGITRYGLGKDAIENSFIPVPPSEEQQRISSHLNNITRKCNEIIKKTNKEIQLLNEYRTIIISVAVTGKIDVRDWKGDKDGLSAYSP